MVVASRLDDVTAARDWVGEHAREAGFDRRAVYEIGLAVAEALTNIVRHAYGGRTDRLIELELAIDDNALRLDIGHSGTPYDPETYEPPDLDEPQAGGYGVFLIHSLLDEVVQDTSAEGLVRLQLVRRRNRTGSSRSGNT